MVLDVENIGGIDSATAALTNGVTVLEGENATNRTSFLQAIIAAMGGDRFTLKGDAADEYEQMEFGDTVVERRFKRQNGSLSMSGDGYLDDPEVAEWFAFLIEENEAHRALTRGDNLKDILTRPIDTTAIEAEMERLKASKPSIDEKLSEIEDRKRDRVEPEQQKQRLESTAADHREDLEAIEAEIEEANTELDAERDAKEAVDGQIEELKHRRAELEGISFEIETLEETIDSPHTEYQENEAASDGLSVDPDLDVPVLRSNLEEFSGGETHAQLTRE